MAGSVPRSRWLRLGCYLSASFLAACSNVPKCQLPPGVAPFPKSHTNPPQLTWPGSDGKTPLPYSASLPANRVPKGVVLLYLGWDTVSGDYATLTNALTHHGYAVYAAENRTFSYGPPRLQGTARDWRPWVEDVKAFSRFVKAKHPGLPVVWHGLSFGAMQVLQATAESEGSEDAPTGIIIHSPAYAMMPSEVKLGKRLLYRAFAGVRFPHLAMMEKQGLGLTTDETWNCQWLLSEDRLQRGYQVSFIIQAVNLGMEARRNSHGLTLPILALWGGQDDLTLKGDDTERPAYNDYMRTELAQGKSTQFYFEDGGHILTEGGPQTEAIQKAAIAAILDWLNANLPSS